MKLLTKLLKLPWQCAWQNEEYYLCGLMVFALLSLQKQIKPYQYIRFLLDIFIFNLLFKITDGNVLVVTESTSSF